MSASYRHSLGDRTYGFASLAEARDAALFLRRGTVGDNVMYFETGQGSSLSANAHHGLDQQTCAGSPTPGSDWVVWGSACRPANC